MVARIRVTWLVARVLLVGALVPAVAVAQPRADVAVWAGGPASEDALAPLAVATLEARGYAVRDAAQVGPLAATLFTPGVMPTPEQASALGAALGASRVFVVWTEPGETPDRVVVRVTSAPDGARGHIVVPAGDARIGLARLLASALERSATAGTQAATQPPAATTQPPAATTQPPAATTQPPAVTAQPPAATTQPPAVTAQPPAATGSPPAAGLAPPDAAPPVTAAEPAPPLVTPEGTTSEGLPRSFVREQDLAPGPPPGGWDGNRGREWGGLIGFGSTAVAGAIALLIGVGMLGSRSTEGAGIAFTVVGGTAFFLGGVIGLPIVLGSFETPGLARESGARYGAVAPARGLSLSGRF